MKHCNGCVSENKPLTDVIETVNGLELFLQLCDECLTKFAAGSAEPIKLDGAIDGGHIEDYEVFSDRQRGKIDKVLNIVGLTRENWNEWRSTRHFPDPGFY